jgi:hypothetical protein
VKSIELYGKIQGDLREKAIVDEEDGTSTGTSPYLAVVRLRKRLPNLLSMFGLKIHLTYDGIFKICKRCYHYHRMGLSCEKCYWCEFVIQFKMENPKIEEDMMNSRSEPTYCTQLNGDFIRQAQRG